MKKALSIVLILALAVIFSCSKKDQETTTDDTTQKELGDVGNKWEANFNEEATKIIEAEIVKNDNGMVDVIFKHEDKNYTLKLQVTENAIIEYVYGDGDLSQPFTMVEFDAKLGDKYIFETKKMVIEREIIDLGSYPIFCLGLTLPLIGVYEFMPLSIGYQLFGYTIAGIWWYWHPVWGLVCVEVTTTNGDFFEIVFQNITM